MPLQKPGMVDLIALEAALGQDVGLEFCHGAVVRATLVLLVMHEPQRLVCRALDGAASAAHSLTPDPPSHTDE